MSSALTADSSREMIHPRYRKDIDGLRALAVLAVVIFHAFPNALPGGFIGVDIFFVISGFLISTIIFENLERGTFSFKKFYLRRVRRIFPALLVVLCATLAFGFVALLADELNLLGKHVATGIAFVANIGFWREAGYFDPASETKPLLHLWSLGIEEQFYLVWPLAIWFLWRKHAGIARAIFALWAISFISNLIWATIDPVATFYSPLTRFWELIAGGALAWLFCSRAGYWPSLSAKFNDAICVRLHRHSHRCGSHIFENLLSVLGFTVIAVGIAFLDEGLVFPGAWGLIPVLGSILIIAAGPQARWNRIFLGNKTAVWIGLISYPLYLWHWPILTYGRILYEEIPPQYFQIGAIFISILLAWLTTRFVERPIRFGSERLSLKVSLLAIVALTLGLAGLFTRNTDFVESRKLEKIKIARASFSFAFGSSLNWFSGKDGWLFLGNAYDSTIEKLTRAISPSETEIRQTTSELEKLSELASKYGARSALLIGPDKPSIYPEYLPDSLKTYKERYIDSFLERLQGINNLTVYDPTDDFKQLKESEGFLYWKTDTHWNSKGAYFAFQGLMKTLQLPYPEVSFKRGEVYQGDLLAFLKTKELTYDNLDNWIPIWADPPSVEEPSPLLKSSSQYSISNSKPLSNMVVWVTGDSFTNGLRRYLEATFAQVRYLGSWREQLDQLPDDLQESKTKPDLILVVRVERSF